VAKQKNVKTLERPKPPKRGGSPPRFQGEVLKRLGLTKGGQNDRPGCVVRISEKRWGGGTLLKVFHLWDRLGANSTESGEGGGRREQGVLGGQEKWSETVLNAQRAPKNAEKKGGMTRKTSHHTQEEKKHLKIKTCPRRGPSC